MKFFILTLIFLKPVFSEDTHNKNSASPSARKVIPFPIKPKKNQSPDVVFDKNNISFLETNQAQYFYQMGLTALEHEDHEVAFEAFSKVLEINPMHYMAYHYRGLTSYQLYLKSSEEEMEQRLFDNITKDFQNTLSLHDFSDSLYLLAFMFSEQEEYEMSYHYYNRLIQKIAKEGDSAYPSFIPKNLLYFLAGELQYKMKNHSQALRHWNKSIALNALYFPAYKEKAKALLAKKQKRPALSVYSQYIQQAQNHIKEKAEKNRSPSRNTKKNIVIDDEQYQSYLSNKENILSFMQTDVEKLAQAYFYRGMIYDSIRGENSKALLDFEQAVIFDPKNIDAVFFYSKSLLENKLLEKSLKWAHKGFFLANLLERPDPPLISEEINALSETQADIMLFGFPYVFLSVQAKAKELLKDYSGALIDLEKMQNLLKSKSKIAVSDFEQEKDFENNIVTQIVNHIRRERSHVKTGIARLKKQQRNSLKNPSRGTQTAFKKTPQAPSNQRKKGRSPCRAQFQK